MSGLVVVPVDIGNVPRCMTIVGYQVPLICMFAYSWLYAYLVECLRCSCMLFMVDARGLAMFLTSVLVMFMLVSMPCLVGYMTYCC